MPNIGQLIKNKRKAAGMSLEKLGTACGVSDSEIMKIENGTRKSPNWSTLCKISHTLKFHPFEILLAAGYITKNDIHPNSQIHGLENLDADDVATVQLFIDFLTMRSGNMDDVSKEE
jgi:transcriptional regulator with XRE-family HTH domain